MNAHEAEREAEVKIRRAHAGTTPCARWFRVSARAERTEKQMSDGLYQAEQDRESFGPDDEKFVSGGDTEHTVEIEGGRFMDASYLRPPASHCSYCGDRREVYDGPRVAWKPCPMCVTSPEGTDQ